jgi:quinol monooxygenase YgiN
MISNGWSLAIAARTAASTSLASRTFKVSTPYSPARSRQSHFDHHRSISDNIRCISNYTCQPRSKNHGSICHQQERERGRSGGGLLVVAQWEAREGQADRVADILSRFLPEAQSEPGAKLFLISRAKENPAQFLFYELFRDEAAFKAHQDSAHFKTYIAGEALPLLAKRERAQYALL